MLLHSFQRALRHLWRQRLFTALNMLGLAIGMSACWVVYLLVHHEFRFESGVPDGDRIFHVVSRFIFDTEESGNAGAPAPLADAIREEVPGVEMTIPLKDQWVQKVSVPQGEGVPPVEFEMQKKIATTTGQYFQLVPYRWLAGSPGDFNAPGKIVLRADRAAQYFPNFTPEQVLGRSLLYNDTLAVTVVGVVAPPDFPTHFDARELVTPGTLSPLGKINPKRWAGVNSNDQIFIKVAPGADVTAMAATINRISAERSAEPMKAFGGKFKRWHVLQPLGDMHFQAEYADNHRKADKKVLFGLMGVAGFLLLLACINFINLATAQLPQRARELGIRKTLGSGSGALVGQFLAETLATGLLSVGLAYGLVRLFFAQFDDFIPEDVAVHANFLPTLLFLTGLLAAICLLSGLYPGWLATKVQPVRILRGEATAGVGKQRITLRKSLIVFQFVAAQLFMLVALVMGRQLHFAMNQDLGFSRDAVLTAGVPLKVLLRDSDNERRFALLGELRRLPGVAGVSLGQPPVAFDYSANAYRLADGDLEAKISRKFVDTAFIDLYQIPLVAGRNLLPADTVREVVINETAARALGIEQPADAVGRFLLESGEGNAPLPVVGVVRDFHTASFSREIEPLALMTDHSSLDQFNIRLASRRPADWADAIGAIGAVWGKFYPEEAFKHQFYDETLAKLYEEERRMARLVNLTTLVAILISCLGLFGLATLTAFQRTKEVGVRKVLGASVASVVALLSRDFLKLVLLALVLAAPVAWWLMNRWLADFAYRIEMRWWMVAAVGGLAALVAFLTVSVQSIRAARANPVKTLRNE